MRDLFFRNFTSKDRKKRMVSSGEIMDKSGVRTIIRRHFVCLVKEVKHCKLEKPAPYMSVVKERNNKAFTEKFFCRIKGGFYIASCGKLYLVIFMHSLKIKLAAISSVVHSM